MEISGKRLLNQAESILRDRKEDPRSGKSTGMTGESKGTPAKTGQTGLNQGVFESRVLDLQESMRKLQNQYSREQARMTYLDHYPEQIDEKLTFDGEPLFPELGGNRNPESLRPEVKARLADLMKGLKSSQVEMENMFALNFQEASTRNLPAGALDLQGVDQGSKLDPARVARLTRP